MHGFDTFYRLSNRPVKDEIITNWDIKGFSNLCDILKTDSTSLVPFLKEFFGIVS
jgi:hypothetical protein